LRPKELAAGGSIGLAREIEFHGITAAGAGARRAHREMQRAQIVRDARKRVIGVDRERPIATRSTIVSRGAKPMNAPCTPPAHGLTLPSSCAGGSIDTETLPPLHESSLA